MNGRMPPLSASTPAAVAAGISLTILAPTPNFGMSRGHSRDHPRTLDLEFRACRWNIMVNSYFTNSYSILGCLHGSRAGEIPIYSYPYSVLITRDGLAPLTVETTVPKIRNPRNSDPNNWRILEPANLRLHFRIG